MPKRAQSRLLRASYLPGIVCGLPQNMAARVRIGGSQGRSGDRGIGDMGIALSNDSHGPSIMC
jgi:hypothetical protein